MSRKKANAPTGKAPVFAPTNALGPTTGTVRVAPQRMWSNKALEGMAKNRNRVEVSRFLQDEIPVVKYAVQTLPKEAIGKGIGVKSISTNPEFKAAATAFFGKWASSTACDLRKESTFYQLQPRWLSAILGDGSCFVQKVKGDEMTRAWSLADKSKRRVQFQTFTRDQACSPASAIDKADRWNDGLLYNNFGQLAKVRICLDGDPYSRDSRFVDLDANFISHLKDNLRFNQEHGTPAIFTSGNDLLDALDLKAVRKHSAKIRASLLGVTTTTGGEVPNAMKQVMKNTQSGVPAVDTGKRFVEIHDGAVMIPLGMNEDIKFFTSGEAVNFAQLLEQLTQPFIYNFGLPPEWIFSMGSLGGASARAILDKVRRAYENMRGLIYPHLQWCWEFVIADAMLPGGPLENFATVDDWNEIDFVCDPDPSVDLGRDHKADMDRWDSHLITAEDYIEQRSAMSGVAVRHASIDEKLDNVRYAIAQATGRPITEVMIPESIAIIIGLGPKVTQAASGLVGSLSAEAIADELSANDDPED